MSDRITARVKMYLEAVASGDAAAIVALYAKDATVEDPVGSPVRKGTKEISAMYHALESVDAVKAELLTVRATEDTAVFHFTVTMNDGGQHTTIEPIDVMTFNSDHLITSMKAYWSDENVTRVD